MEQNAGQRCQQQHDQSRSLRHCGCQAQSVNGGRHDKHPAEAGEAARQSYERRQRERPYPPRCPGRARGVQRGPQRVLSPQAECVRRHAKSQSDRQHSPQNRYTGQRGRALQKPLPSENANSLPHRQHERQPPANVAARPVGKQSRQRREECHAESRAARPRPPQSQQKARQGRDDNAAADGG